MGRASRKQVPSPLGHDVLRSRVDQSSCLVFQTGLLHRPWGARHRKVGKNPQFPQRHWEHNQHLQMDKKKYIKFLVGGNVLLHTKKETVSKKRLQQYL